MLIGDILYKLRGDASSLIRSSKQGAEALKEVEDKAGQAKVGFNDLAEMTTSLGDVFESVIGGVMAAGMANFLKRITLTAARTQVLGTTLLVVGQNSGYTRDELERTENALKDLGITTQVARESLTRMVQTEMDVTEATKLANAARNLAVVAGKNTSDTLNTMIHGLVTQQAETLRTVGITLSMQEVMKKWAAENKKTVLSMTEREKRQAIMNAIIEQAASLEGAYETAMSDSGKQLTSFARYTEEVANSLGEFMLPALNAVLQSLAKLFKQFVKLDPETRRLIVTMATFTTTLIALSVAVKGLVILGPRLKALVVSILSMAKAHPVLAALTVGVALFTAAWSTNMGNVREYTEVFVSYMLLALNTIVSSLLSTAKVQSDFFDSLRKSFLHPFSAKKIWSEFLSESKVAVQTVAIAWEEGMDRIGKAHTAFMKAQYKSSIALKEGTLALTDEQIEARNKMKDAGIKVTGEMGREISKLTGAELQAYVAAELLKEEERKKAMKAAMDLENKLFTGRMELRKKDVLLTFEAERAIMDNKVKMGKMSANVAAEIQAQALVTRLEAELQAAEEVERFQRDFQKRMAEAGHAKKEEAELSILKVEKETEGVRVKLANARLAAEVTAQQDRLSQLEKNHAKEISQIETLHAVEGAMDQASVMRKSMLEDEAVENSLNRQEDLLREKLRLLDLELVHMQESGITQGQAYKDKIEERQDLETDLAKHLIMSDEELAKARLSVQRQLMDERSALAKEMVFMEVKDERLQRLLSLEIQVKEDVRKHKEMVEDNKMTQEEYMKWEQRRMLQLQDSKELIRLEDIKGTDEWAEKMREIWEQAGVDEVEIRRRVTAEKLEINQNFTEGVKMGLEELAADQYTFSQAGFDSMLSFSNATSNMMSDVLFDAVRGEFTSIEDYATAAGEVMLRTLTNALSQLAAQWIINTLLQQTSISKTQSGLAAEGAAVDALIVKYLALAAAKIAAGVSGPAAAAGGAHFGGWVTPEGFASGGMVPGVGTGDKVPIMAEPGEYILTRGETKTLLPILHKMLAPMPKRGYQEGGMVAPVSSRTQERNQEQESLTVVTVFNEDELYKFFGSKKYGRVVANRVTSGMSASMGK